MTFPLKLKLYICSIAIIFYSCNSKDSSKDSFDPQSALRKPAIPEVSIEIAKNKDFKYSISTNGKIESASNRIFISELNTQIIDLPFSNGQLVKAGQVILQYDTTLLHLKKERLLLTLFNAEREFESQILAYENLFRSKSSEEIAAIRQKLKISSGLSFAEQDIKEVEYEIFRSKIVSPFNGIVANLSVQNGEIVKIGQPLFSLYDPQALVLNAVMLESDISLIKNGVKVDIHTLSNESYSINGVLKEINPMVDRDGLIRVKIGLSCKSLISQNLFPGMNCIANVNFTFNNRLVIPKSSLVLRSGKYVVFTYIDGVAKWNYVDIGKDNGNEVEILKGLNLNDKVITSNNLQLSHDASVKVIELRSNL